MIVLFEMDPARIMMLLSRQETLRRKTFHGTTENFDIVLTVMALRRGLLDSSRCVVDGIAVNVWLSVKKQQCLFFNLQSAITLISGSSQMTCRCGVFVGF